MFLKVGGPTQIYHFTVSKNDQIRVCIFLYIVANQEHREMK